MDEMEELFGEMERLLNARKDRDVTYRYKIYRRPELSHPVILRVRDYEREVLGSREQLAGNCQLLDQDDWKVMVRNLFGKKYPQMLRLAEHELLDDFIMTFAVKLNDQKSLIIDSVQRENLGKLIEDLRIRDSMTQATLALLDEYPDSDSDEDHLMPDLVMSCQSRNLTDGETKKLCSYKRFIVPLPEEIDWIFLRYEAGMPLLSEKAGGSEEQDPEAADIRRLVALLMEAEYCRAMRAEYSDGDRPRLLDDSDEPLNDDESGLIERLGSIARNEIRRRICLIGFSDMSEVPPERHHWVDDAIDKLLHSPDQYVTSLRSLSNLIDRSFMNPGKADPAEKIRAFAMGNRETLLEDLKRANADMRSSDDAIRLLGEALDGKEKSLCEIGFMYHFGQGVRQDCGKAVKWYKASAMQGDAGAEYSLGDLYRKGHGVSQDDVEASLWYRRAFRRYLNNAKWGNDASQFFVGRMYMYGLGVDQNDEEAEKWYRKSAEQGIKQAQHALAFYYNSDRHCDPIESAKWMLKAAEQGDLYCQRWAGERYLKGEGVVKDEREAARWYRRAAEQGDAESQKMLGDMYRSGQGLERDDVAAEEWYRRAAEGGSEKAKECLDFLTAGREAERGTPEACAALPGSRLDDLDNIDNEDVPF